LALDAARAEFVAGHVEASLAHCQAAARLAEGAGRPDILAAAALVITGMGDPATTTAVDTLCARALGAAPARDTALRARLRARQAIFAAETGAGTRARDLSAEALALALSNRQVAERLVLSERTVETHVRSILAKLGYSTRTEIATWSLRRATPQ
jgi:DNA-binding CsgD family transcriptional regulator